VHYAQAWDDLAGFAQRFGIPVAETFGGKGAMREDAWFLLGGAGAQGTPAAAQVMKDADLVICVGTRLTDFTTGSHSAFANPEVRFIHINVTARDAHKLGALPLVADAREALRALHKAAEAAGVQYGDAYRQEVTEIKERWTSEYQSSLQPGPGEAMNQGQLIRTLNEFARPGDTVVAAAGTPPGDLLKTWDATCGRNCHLEFGYSCMGYEIPGGLGVRLAVAQGLRLGHGGTELQVPEGEVYVYIGDGTYILNPGELVTAVQLGLKVTVVISENHGYQSIYGLQMGTVGHDFGNEFVPEDGHREGGYLKLDLAQSAAGLGACAFHADSPERLRAALEAARQETRPCVIVAETEAHRYLPPSGVWWDVAPAEVSNDAETQQRRADYERDRDTLQRFYY
jgi:3D-(3,5/4)-trihydroxycyclohexane-1,2-dione acylhydrolase (decyclizing)